MRCFTYEKQGGEGKEEGRKIQVKKGQKGARNKKRKIRQEKLKTIL